MRVRQYRLIEENISDMILLLDPSGRIKHVSPAHKTILGISLDQYNRIFPKGIIHPDDVERARHSFALMEQVKQAPCQTEIGLLHTDGSWRYPAVRGIPVTDTEGQVIK